MRFLVSTFGRDGAELVIKAMRELPYDRLVLIGGSDIEHSKGFRTLGRLEESSGHRIEVEKLDQDDFLGLVDGITGILERYSKGASNSVLLNISGGSKLVGDAAILAAFRLGIETYHCDSRVVKLPILKGATARDRFTGHQKQMVKGIGEDALSLDELVSKMKPASKQAAERVLRELRNQGLLQTRVESGTILISLSRTGLEVLRAVRSGEK